MEDSSRMGEKSFKMLYLFFCSLFVRYGHKRRLFFGGDPQPAGWYFIQLAAHSQLQIGESRICQTLTGLGAFQEKAGRALAETPPSFFWNIFYAERVTLVPVHGTASPQLLPSWSSHLWLLISLLWNFPLQLVSLGLPAGKFSGCPTYLKHLESFTLLTCPPHRQAEQSLISPDQIPQQSSAKTPAPKASRVWCGVHTHKFAQGFVTTSASHPLQLGECDVCCNQVTFLPPQTHSGNVMRHSPCPGCPGVRDVAGVPVLPFVSLRLQILDSLPWKKSVFSWVDLNKTLEKTWTSMH